MSRLAVLQSELGDHDGALARLEQLTAIFEGAGGHSHGRHLLRIGDVLSKLGRTREAVDLHRAALQSLERTVTPTHPILGGAHLALALDLHALGAVAEGRDHYRSSLAITSPSHRDDDGRSDFRRAGGWEALAAWHAATGEYERALELYTRTVSALESTLGPDAPALLEPLAGIAHAEQAIAARTLGAHGGAHDRPRAPIGTTGALPQLRPDTAHGGPASGETPSVQVHLERARIAFERALALTGECTPAPEMLGGLKFGLAQSIAASGTDSREARELAEQARGHFSQALPHQREALRAVENWLARH